MMFSQAILSSTFDLTRISLSSYFVLSTNIPKSSYHVLLIQISIFAYSTAIIQNHFMFIHYQTDFSVVFFVIQSANIIEKH